MKKTVDEINKMIMEDAPMEEINDAIGYIDIYSCFDPILSRLLIFWKNAASVGKRHSPLSAKPLSARSETHGM